jgi:hypothetical protein
VRAGVEERASTRNVRTSDRTNGEKRNVIDQRTHRHTQRERERGGREREEGEREMKREWEYKARELRPHNSNYDSARLGSAPLCTPPLANETELQFLE